MEKVDPWLMWAFFLPVLVGLLSLILMDGRMAVSAFWGWFLVALVLSGLRIVAMRS